MRRKASGPGTFEWCYMMLTLVVFAAMPLIAGNQVIGRDSLNLFDTLKHQGDGGDQTTQIISAALYAGFAMLLARQARPKAILLLGYPLLFLLLWSFMTIAWSVDPDVSFRRCVALAGCTVLSVYVGLRFDEHQMMRLLTFSTCIVLLTSLTVGIVAPSHGFDFAGNFRGVFPGKNVMGEYAAVALLVVISRLLHRKLNGTLATIGLGILGCITVICLDLANSASIVPALLSALTALLLARLIRLSDGASLTLVVPIAVCCATGAGFVLYGNWDSLVELMGRKPDISGRTEIWEFVVKMISDSPMIGYGYQAFWEGSHSPGAAFWRATGNGAPDAHDGWLQLMLDTGGIGVLVFVVATVVLVVNLFRLLRQTQSESWFVEWAISFLAFYLVTSFSEANIWIGTVNFQLLFLYIVVRSNIMMRQTALSGRRQSFGVLRAQMPARQSMRVP